MHRLILMVLLSVLLFTPIPARARDRCQDFVPDVRANMIRYNGLEYPWWYSMGCMIQESNCRPDVISFDGGIGLFQLTPSTGIVADIRKEIPVDPYNPTSNIRAHAFYINKIRNTYLKRGPFKFKGKYMISPKDFTMKCGSNLADVYRYYNGGYWFIYESQLADPTYACEQEKMKAHCVRGGTWVGSGSKKRWLSFCEVNYSYSDKVYKYSQKYKTGKDGINFYYTKKPSEKSVEELETNSEKESNKNSLKVKVSAVSKVKVSEKLSLLNKIIISFFKFFNLQEDRENYDRETEKLVLRTVKSV